MPELTTAAPSPAEAARPPVQEEVLADTTTYEAVDALARPLGRTALGVALLAVVDAIGPTTRGSELLATAGDGSGFAIGVDRSLPLLTRLLALPPVVDTHVTLRRDGEELHLRASPAGLVLYPGDDRARSLAAVAHEPVRVLLRQLAAPGAADRWTEALPDRSDLLVDAAPLGPAALRLRWEARHEQEAIAAAGLLTDWLGLADLPAAGVDQHAWMRGRGIALPLFPLVGSWFDWLRSRGVLAPAVGQLRFGHRSRELPEAAPAGEGPAARIAALLAEQRDLIARVLSGQVDADDLVAVPALQPARLAAAEPDLVPVWDEIAATITELAAQVADSSDAAPGRRLRVADLGGSASANPHLRTVLEGPEVTTTAVPTGRPPAPSAPHDVVVALGALHRWEDPRQAVEAVSQLLRPGGTLLAVENTALTPLGMLIAGLLAGQSVAGSVHDTQTWLPQLRAVGLPADATPVGPTPAVLLRAHRDGREVPAASTPDEHDGPPRPGTETEVARLWAELLPTPPRGRGDSFFALGGDSLRATRFVAALQQRFGTTIALRDLFAQPQLGDVARLVDDATALGRDEDAEEGVL